MLLRSSCVTSIYRIMNMKRYFFPSLLFFLPITMLAQTIVISKPPVDTASFFHWPTIAGYGQPALSNDGKFVMYIIHNIPAKGNTLVIHCLKTKQEISLTNITDAKFSDDSQHLIYMNGRDSLCLLTIASNKREYVTTVASWSLFMQKRQEWLSIQKNTHDHELILRNLVTGKALLYQNVGAYDRSADGQTIIIAGLPDPKNQNTVTLTWVSLITGEKKEIWTGQNPSGAMPDYKGQLWAFTGQNTQGQKAIFFYKTNTSKAVELVNDHTAGIPLKMEFGSLNNFNKNGDKLFCTIRTKRILMPNLFNVKINIWSYIDAKLLPKQEEDLSRPQSYLAVISLKKLSVIRLQQENELIDDRNDDLIIVTKRLGNPAEEYWNKEAVGKTYLVETSTGCRRLLPIHNGHISPQGKYVLGYGPGISSRDFFCHEVQTGKMYSLTSKMDIPFLKDVKAMSRIYQFRGLTEAAWTKADKEIFIYDSNDMWLVDPKGQKKPENLTNGLKSGWQFQLGSNLRDNKQSIDSEQRILLKGFNTNTKESGFYSLSLKNKKSLKQLHIANAEFGIIRNGGSGEVGYFVKARDTSIYIVEVQHSSISPNFYETSDFVTFSQISNVHPEKQFNWFTSKLFNFKAINGFLTQGIVYKPENFDERKKYPVIIHYYEHNKSDLANQYQHPISGTGAELDIPWFTSHGYIIIVTDIHNVTDKNGPMHAETGNSALQTLKALTKYISKLGYVDRKHIGIQGHSFAAWETNYIVTHCNLFSAAVSASGVSDMSERWKEDNAYVEGRGYFMGVTPWERPDLYIKNSPIYAVGQVRTPILLMANPNDYRVSWQQGVKFFTALRRAGKRAWMLSYDNGAHGVSGNDYKDYLLRQTQFFDHYLKGAPAPIWMTRGIPASQKGQIDGFAYDTDIKTPGPGLNYDPVIIKKRTKVHKKTSFQTGK
jgi:dienelactone hydrolase